MSFITNQPIKEEDIETIPLYEEKLVLVLHESHPMANNEINYAERIGK